MPEKSRLQPGMCVEEGMVWNEFLGKCVDAYSIERVAGVDFQRKSCLGKFEGNFNCDFGRELYELAGISGFDEQIGDVQHLGWFAKVDLSDLGIRELGAPVAGVIVTEDNSGFFDYEPFETIEEMESKWNEIEREYEEFYEGAEEEDFY